MQLLMSIMALMEASEGTYTSAVGGAVFAFEGIP